MPFIAPKAPTLRLPRSATFVASAMDPAQRFTFLLSLVLVSVLLPILSIIILSHLKSQRHACLIEKKQPIQI